MFFGWDLAVNDCVKILNPHERRMTFKKDRAV